MSLKEQIARRRMRRRGPLGFAVGVLTASCVTGIGLIQGLSPYTICTRAMLGGVILGLLCSFGLTIIDMANLPK